MSSTSPKPAKPYCPSTWLAPHLTPFNLTVASVLGGLTAVFFTVIALLIIVALNINVLGWIE
jgi:hypothetical protein